MRNQLINISIIFLFFCSCRNNIEKRIGIKGRDCYNTKQNCEVIISQITNFKWDKMFVFDPPETLDAMNRAMGVDYSKYYEDYTRAIVFLNGNKIVHYENNRADAEGVVDGQVVFDFPDSLKYQVYTPRSAKFKLTAKTFGDKVYYQLSFSSK
jgi:hypothetical protein